MVRGINVYTTLEPKKVQGWGAGAGCFWLLGAVAGAAWKKKSGAGKN